ncbi:hypothetical protein J4401_03460 [Candidatus Woesearchaeota archaeon]|nr:hypothetical protein [Candidatus Woesearchaeota archaeon]
MPIFGKKKESNDAYGGMPPSMPQDPAAPEQFEPEGSAQEPYGNFYNEQQPDAGMPNMPPPDNSQYQEQYQQQPQEPYQGYGAMPERPQEEGNERIEEIAEAIIEEKWSELIKDINKITEWKEHADTEIRRLGQEIVNLKERFESLHKGVLGKITEYDQNLTNVGTEIKAMEKVFQNILPTFTENVNKLERVMKSK